MAFVTALATFIGALLVGAFLFVIAFAVVVAETIWAAYVATIVWGWYVVPYYGIKPPSVIITFGLLLLARLFCPSNRVSDDDDKKWAPIMVAIMRPLGVLIVAWIGTHWL